jgi:large subunit ribosomal protein L16
MCNRKFETSLMNGICYKGNCICFGRYALQALEPAWITSKQIKARRRAMTQNVRRETFVESSV